MKAIPSGRCAAIRTPPEAGADPRGALNAYTAGAFARSFEVDGK